MGNVVNEYLEWQTAHPKPNLTEMQDGILKLRKEPGEEMAHRLLQEQGRKLVPRSHCPK